MSQPGSTSVREFLIKPEPGIPGFFFRPTFTKIVLLMILVGVTSFIVTGRKATSKVSWQEKRGVPLAFMTIVVYKGPCPQNNTCQEANLQTFNTFALLLDIFSWYVISCLMEFMYVFVNDIKASP